MSGEWLRQPGNAPIHNTICQHQPAPQPRQAGVEHARKVSPVLFLLGVFGNDIPLLRVQHVLQRQGYFLQLDPAIGQGVRDVAPAVEGLLLPLLGGASGPVGAARLHEASPVGVGRRDGAIVTGSAARQKPGFSAKPRFGAGRYPGDPEPARAGLVRRCWEMGKRPAGPLGLAANQAGPALLWPDDLRYRTTAWTWHSARFRLSQTPRLRRCARPAKTGGLSVTPDGRTLAVTHHQWGRGQRGHAKGDTRDC